jgi:hypothetical protein
LPATYVCFVILLVHDHQKVEDLFLFVYWAFQRAVHDRDLEIIEAHFDIATECSSGHQTGDSDGNEVDLYKLPWHFFSLQLFYNMWTFSYEHFWVNPLCNCTGCWLLALIIVWNWRIPTTRSYACFEVFENHPIQSLLCKIYEKSYYSYMVDGMQIFNTVLWSFCLSLITVWAEQLQLK